MAHDIDESQWEAIDAEIYAHRLISAIKLYREASGVGLKDAKDAVEARQDQLRQATPERFAPKGRSGCMSVLLLVVTVLSVVTYYF